VALLLSLFTEQTVAFPTIASSAQGRSGFGNPPAIGNKSESAGVLRRRALLGDLTRRVALGRPWEDRCRSENYIRFVLEAHVEQSVKRVRGDETAHQMSDPWCLARVDEAKATEAEIRMIRQQSTLVERMIEAFNAAKSDAELSAAMKMVVKLTALEKVPSIRLSN
jgi:hypothetical protein